MQKSEVVVIVIQPISLSLSPATLSMRFFFRSTRYGFKLASNHQVPFLWVFFISAISSFFSSLTVISTCFTNGNFSETHHFNKRRTGFFLFVGIHCDNATFLFIGLCQLIDAFLKSQLNFINRRTFIFCFRCCLLSSKAFLCSL